MWVNNVICIVCICDLWLVPGKLLWLSKHSPLLCVFFLMVYISARCFRSTNWTFEPPGFHFRILTIWIPVFYFPQNATNFFHGVAVLMHGLLLLYSSIFMIFKIIQWSQDVLIEFFSKTINRSNLFWIWKWINQNL